MKITLDADEQLARDIRTATGVAYDFTLQVCIGAPGAKYSRLVSAQLYSWALVGGSCKHEPKVLETEWIVLEPAELEPVT